MFRPLKSALARLLARNLTIAPPVRTSVTRRDAHRFRPRLEQVEDRTVPTPVVTVAWVSDAAEGGGGAIRAQLTRSEVTSQSLTVGVAYSGTATAGSDYPTQPSTATFAPFASAVTIGFAATDDSVSEPTETVVLTVQPGSGYTVGTADSTTVNIFDNDAQYVSVEKLSDAAEGGADGTFRFTRIGDLSSSLGVSYTVGGTATSGTDYAALGGSVTFAAGASTADVTVAASTDAVYDPDETVSVTVGSGTGYSVGSPSSAELSIADNIDSVQTVVYQGSFHLSGSGAGVDVTLTVTYNAPGAEGLYTWSCAVSNPSSNATALTSFSVPVDGMDTDVANLASSNGWAGSVGTDSVSWTAGTGLSPGSSATFSFTTAPREIGEADISAGGGGGFLADLPTAPAPLPVTNTPRQARINFLAGGLNLQRQVYTVSIDIVTSSGTYSSGTVDIDTATPNDACDTIYTYLRDAGWAVEKLGNNSLRILGKKNSDGTIDGIRSATLTITNYNSAYSNPPSIQGDSGIPVSRTVS